MEATATPLRVAILEDEHVLLEALCLALDGASIQVVACCTTPLAFLDSVRSALPPVAIIDLKLEEDSGREVDGGLTVLLALRESVPDVRTVVLSANREPAMVDRCFNLGARAYLFKHSVGVEELISTVHAVARGERLFPATRLPYQSPSFESSPGPLHSLSPREREVLSFVVSGVDNLKIGAHLGITERTVKAHLSSLYRKLSCDNRTQLALKGRELGALPRRDL